MRVVYVCSCCGDDIYEGDRFLNLTDDQYCVNCVEQNTETAEYDEDAE